MKNIYDNIMFGEVELNKIDIKPLCIMHGGLIKGGVTPDTVRYPRAEECNMSSGMLKEKNHG